MKSAQSVRSCSWPTENLTTWRVKKEVSVFIQGPLAGKRHIICSEHTVHATRECLFLFRRFNWWHLAFVPIAYQILFLLPMLGSARGLKHTEATNRSNYSLCSATCLVAVTFNYKSRALLFCKSIIGCPLSTVFVFFFSFLSSAFGSIISQLRPLLLMVFECSCQSAW